MMMKLLNQVKKMMRMENHQHVKIICYILYHFFGNFYLHLFHQQVKSFLKEFQNHDFYICIGIAGGWVCFCVSIIIIGMLTAVIGDLATHVNNF